MKFVKFIYLKYIFRQYGTDLEMGSIVLEYKNA